MTGCLCPTPSDNLPTLAGIQPAELRRIGATLSLARRAIEPGHLLHLALTSPSSANALPLKSRRPFVPTTQHLISLSGNKIRAAQWADYQWNVKWTDSPTRLRIFITDTSTHPLGMTLRTAWVRLTRLCTSVRRFSSCMHKYSMASSAACECHEAEQTVDHIGTPMSNPSISSWTAWPDGSGRWDNRVAAQHLPWDLVRPSRGCKELVQKNLLCKIRWLFCTWCFATKIYTNLLQPQALALRMM